MKQSRITGVVVHFRSYDTVTGAVQSLLDEGVLADDLVVVDNSGEPDRRAELRESIPADVEILFEQNRGYGAAVNVAIDHFSARTAPPPDFFVVATHETRIAVGTLEALRGALIADPSAAVAGPTLVSGNEPGDPDAFVWSTGGYLTRVLHLPAHHDHRASLASLVSRPSPVERRWLDGAFLLYRTEDLTRNRISEDFFLYMEETDLHLRLGRQGRKILWVPSGQVWQTSGGVPPYYLARNLRLLAARQDGRLRGSAGTAVAVARRLASDVRKGQGWGSAMQLLAGLSARLPATARDLSAPSISIVNPLGGALAHYELELAEVLIAGGAVVIRRSTAEPSLAGTSRVAWLVGYLRLLVAARADSGRAPRTRVIVLWPVLGYWDLILLALVGLRRASLVVHDPHPLVDAIGYSPRARQIAGVIAPLVELVTHSGKAARVVESEMPWSRRKRLPHPVLRPTERHEDRLSSEPPVVRVLGQYKRDRDLAALGEIAEAVNDSALLQIHGRRWPKVAGWEVDSRFVPEEELDELLGSSAAIVIPYRSFFQSGIAIRSIEAGTPVVGPRESSLAEIFGSNSPLLVSERQSWAAAVRSAISSDRVVVRDTAETWWNKNVMEWKRWATR